MKENTNGQAVQGKPADQANKGNDGATANPKNTIMTPEKTKAPIENKENDQTRDVKRQQEEKDSQASRTPVGEQKRNVTDDKNAPKREGNSPEQVRTPVGNKSNRQVEGAEIADDEDRDDEEISEDQETSETERKQGMPVSFDH